jgi:hypothetical protein
MSDYQDDNRDITVAVTRESTIGRSSKDKEMALQATKKGSLEIMITE